MTQNKKFIKIYESDINFYNSSPYDVIEKFVKPYVTSLRNAKQKYDIRESNIKGDVPEYVIELVEKLTKIKIYNK